MIALFILKFFNFLSAPIIKGSSLSEDRHNSDQANQLISWVLENVLTKQKLESFSNKDESKKLPQGDDVKESKDIEKS
jgi:hypothetical protein